MEGGGDLLNMWLQKRENYCTKSFPVVIHEKLAKELEIID